MEYVILRTNTTKILHNYHVFVNCLAPNSSKIFQKTFQNASKGFFAEQPNCGEPQNNVFYGVWDRSRKKLLLRKISDWLRRFYIGRFIRKKMICKQCGRDYVGGNRCPYCGQYSEIAFNQGVDEERKSTALDGLPNVETENGYADSAYCYPAIGGTYYGAEYAAANSMQGVQISPEEFYHRYRDHSLLEKSKKIVKILKLVVLILELVALVGSIAIIAIDVNLLPEIFGYGAHFGSKGESFSFVYKLFLLMALFIFIPLILACIGEILDWVSMKTFSEKILSNKIDGISLLTQERLSDRKGKKEYIFISNSLCMIDEPSQKIIMGIRVITKTVLNIALLAVAINFISYMILTWMPAAGNLELIYKDNKFWLDPNILLFPIMFWSDLIINSILSVIVNRKYTRWIKNKNN